MGYFHEVIPKISFPLAISSQVFQDLSDFKLILEVEPETEREKHPKDERQEPWHEHQERDLEIKLMQQILRDKDRLGDELQPQTLGTKHTAAVR